MILLCQPLEGEKREKMESHSWFSEAEQQFSIIQASGLHSPGVKLLLSKLLYQIKPYDI